jgi:hypothetical protein
MRRNLVQNGLQEQEGQPWLAKAASGIVAYVGFLWVLKRLLEDGLDLTGNRPLLLYAIVTFVLWVFLFCLRRSEELKDGNWPKILGAWIWTGGLALLVLVGLIVTSPKVPLLPTSVVVTYEDSSTSRVEVNGLITVRPGETVTIAVDPSVITDDLKKDLRFDWDAKWGVIWSKGDGSEAAYSAPKDHSADYVLLYMKKSGESACQPFNVVIQER